MTEANIFFENSSPELITIITTYQCTAACTDCCFESNPTIRGRLSEDKIKSFIAESHENFKSLKVAVFSGGEPLLLGRALFNSIQFASSRKLMTRIVTNGYWGKTTNLAKKTATHLKDAGLTEINISTGIDHAKYVPIEHVINAIKALAEQGIRNRVTIEADFKEGTFHQTLLNHEVIQSILEEFPHLLSFQVNTWMPFHATSATRKAPPIESMDIPCSQLFNNMVLTPHERIASCCGLTFEHIDQLKLGFYEPGNLKELYNSQFEDFLKIWIKVDGPLTIIRKVMGDAYIDTLGDIHHLCQACAILHKNPAILQNLQAKYTDHIEEVLSKYHKDQFIQKLEKELAGVSYEA